MISLVVLHIGETYLEKFKGQTRLRFDDVSVSGLCFQVNIIYIDFITASMKSF